MDAASRAALREKIAQMREALIAEGRLAIPPARTDVVSQPDEDEAPLTAMNQSIASSRNRQRAARLAKLDEALALLDGDPDEYGICEDCEEPIKRRRLELMPWVTLCVRCQEKHERDDRSPGGRRHLTDFK